MIIVLFIIAYVTNAPWWVYVVIFVVVISWNAAPKKKSKPVVPDLDAEKSKDETIRAEVRREILTEYVEYQNALDKRERAIAARELNASDLKPGSIKMIRNTLMKLHEARRTDADYQASATCREATAILQGLNQIIEKRK